MKLSIEVITPEIAEKYLAANTNNYRKLDHRHVKRLAADMTDGKWEETAEPISFSDSGVLRNGQHRLAAIVKSGVAQTMVVARGVTANIFDNQKKRTDAQYYKNIGISSYAASNSAGCLAGMILANSLNFNAGANVSTASKGDFLSRHEAELNSVIEVVNSGSTTPLSNKAAVWCAAWCLFVQGAKLDQLSDFFYVVNSGFPVDWKECSPAIALRNQLLQEKSSAKSRLCMADDFSGTIRAFIDFRKGISRRNTYRFDSKTTSYLEYAHFAATSNQ